MQNIDYGMLAVVLSSLVLMLVAVFLAIWGTFSIKSIQANLQASIDADIDKRIKESADKYIKDIVDSKIRSAPESQADEATADKIGGKSRANDGKNEST